MFDRIVGRYDFLNRVLSMRLDVVWRNHMARMLPKGSDLRVLDLASGTGDMMLAILNANSNVSRVVGLDMAQKMLSKGKDKLQKRQVSDVAPLVRADAASIAAAGESFDAVTMAFGIRNVENVLGALRDARRVLKPGGRLLILEFSLPRGPLCWAYLFYLRHVMTRVGGLLSGDAAAYQYLNRTIESFPCGEAFCQLLRDTGFRNVRALPQSFGIATIYRGER